MNKMYSLMLVLFISISAFAADRPRSGRLTITTFDNTNIRVDIDGRRYSNGDNTIRINNINPGNHSIRVYRSQSSGIFGGNREKLLYSGNVYVKPEHRVDIMIDRYGRAQVQERDLDKKKKKKDRRNDDDDRWQDYDSWERNNDRRGRDDDRWDRNDDRRDRNDDRWDRNDRNNSGYGRAVSNETFQSMKYSLRRENFENTRMTVAKQMIDRNYFESSQVRELLQLFSFENNRLELAKHAYRNTIDRKNYYAVFDVFSFNSSKEELSRYINEVR
ncbi:MAG TPA: DUF4476 domain-containing protein [Chitinophagaceae bacterium]